MRNFGKDQLNIFHVEIISSHTGAANDDPVPSEQSESDDKPYLPHDQYSIEISE